MLEPSALTAPVFSAPVVPDVEQALTSAQRHYQRNKSACMTRSKQWYAANKERVLKQQKQKKRAQFERLWGRQQPSHCELCGATNGKRALAADHDHTTGQPRLFLCCHCNRILGVIEKEWTRVQEVLAYLYRDKDISITHCVDINVLARGDYPQSPHAAPADVTWIRKTLESATKSKKREKA